LQLSQKEVLHLQDALEHEKLCVTKYNYYAQQLQDPQLSSIFRDLANREQQHVDTVTSLLQQGGIQTS